MIRPALYLVGLILLSGLASQAHADTVSAWGYGSYNNTGTNQTINVPMFDTVGGRYYLTAVTVTVYHSGYASFSVDNDRNQSRTVYCQELRNWSLSGAGVTSSANYTWNSDSVTLARDNGDRNYMSFNPPDGYVFGRVGYADTINGSPILVGSSHYNQYQQSGGGNVAFTADVTDITNQLVFTSTRNTYQSSITNGAPNLKISIKVDYEWAAVPEPGTWLLMATGCGGILLWRRRQRGSARDSVVRKDRQS